MIQLLLRLLTRGDARVQLCHALAALGNLRGEFFHRGLHLAECKRARRGHRRIRRRLAKIFQKAKRLRKQGFEHVLLFLGGLLRHERLCVVRVKAGEARKQLQRSARFAPVAVDVHVLHLYHAHAQMHLTFCLPACGHSVSISEKRRYRPVKGRSARPR